MFLKKLAASIPAPVRAVLVPILGALLFLAVWMLLDVVFTLRYPRREHHISFWYFPSIDVTVLLAFFALLGWWRRRLMMGALIALALVATVVRLFRLADGVLHIVYFRPVTVYLDLPMIPEVVRLLHTTVPTSKLVLYGLLLLLILCLFVALMYGALLYAQNYLALGWRQRGLFVGVVVVFLGLSVAFPQEKPSNLRKGFFAASVMPMAIEQIRYAASTDRLRREKVHEMNVVQERLNNLPSDLKTLGGADVLLFLVESYGSAVFRNRMMHDTGCPALGEFESAMAGGGFFTASNFLNSTVYGGGSWLAHASLATGVAVRDDLEFTLIRQQINPPPLTMASLFKRAGYRTVLVQPGMTRPWPEGVVFGFEQKYYAWQMGYEGPNFGWGPMPDQYVIDFVQRTELDAPKRAPVFALYTLISSHAPWTPVPMVVDDWSKLKGGEIFHKSHSLTFPISWNNLNEGGVAYSYSLCYEFEVIKRYITQQLKRDALVIILGDHQPPGSITFDDPSWAVPIHVVSRSKEVIGRFTGAGYTAGMTPKENNKIHGIEALLPDLFTLLSQKAAPAPNPTALHK